jgi:hypothetical protein
MVSGNGVKPIIDQFARFTLRNRATRAGPPQLKHAAAFNPHWFTAWRGCAAAIRSNRFTSINEIRRSAAVFPTDPAPKLSGTS